MINVAGDELESLLLLEKCESGGTGRRARLRGVWIHRTGSSPVSRTKDRFERNGPFFAFEREAMDFCISVGKKGILEKKDRRRLPCGAFPENPTE